MKRVLLLLAEGFEAIEGAAFADVIGWAGSDAGLPVEIVSAALRPQVRCTFGYAVAPDLTLDRVDLDAFDALAIPGGFEAAGFYDDAYSAPFLEAIRRFHGGGKPIATICVGALPVAKSGVLAGRRATTYHLMNGVRRTQLAALGAEVVDAPLVQDAGVITSTSPATAMDVAFELLAQLTSPADARKVKQLMGFDPS